MVWDLLGEKKKKKGREPPLVIPDQICIQIRTNIRKFPQILLFANTLPRIAFANLPMHINFAFLLQTWDACPSFRQFSAAGEPWWRTV